MINSGDKKEAKLLTSAIIVTALLVGSLCLLAYVFLQYTDKHPYFAYVTYLCYGLGAAFVGLVLFSNVGRKAIFTVLFLGFVNAVFKIISEYFRGYDIPAWPFVLIVCAVVGLMAFSAYKHRGRVKLGLNEDSNKKK